MGLFKVIIPVALPSGEVAEWSHFITATDLATAVTAANAFQSSLSGAAPWKALFTSSTTFQPPQIQEVDQPTGTIVRTAVGSGSYVGSAANSPLPPQVAVTVTLRTGFSGGRQRGRYYIPAITVNNVGTTGTMTAGVNATIANALGAAHLAEKGTDPSVVVQVYSRAGRFSTVVTNLDVGNIFDTQRRRRNKLVEIRAGAVI